MDVGARARVAGGTRRWGFVAAAAAVGMTSVLAIAVATHGGSSAGSSTRAGGSAPTEPSPTRLETAVGWVDGLADGLILPSDVRSRLWSQDPVLARHVSSAWAELSTSGSPARLRSAVRWVNGLAAGVIIPSDVASRLRGQDPSLAKIVTQAWAELYPVAQEPN